MKVGVLISKKKRQALVPRGIFESTANIEYVLLDEDDDLTSQCEGVDLLLTKVSDFGNDRVLKFLSETDIRQLVSEDKQRLVTDRLDTYNRLKDVVNMAVTKPARGGCKTFPVIIKTRLACGPAFSHKMAIIREFVNANQVMEELQDELIMQQFIPHDGKLFKVFGVGDDLFVFIRPSISETSPPEGVFDSQKYFKNLEAVQAKADAVDVELLTVIGRNIGQETQLKLFGFDAVKDEHGCFVVVDVNYFPSFAEVVDFPRLLESLLLTS